MQACWECCMSIDNIFFSKYANEDFTRTISIVSHITYDSAIKDCDLAYILECRTCRLQPLISCAYNRPNTWFSISMNGCFEDKAVTYYEINRCAGVYLHKFHMVDGSTYTVGSHTNDFHFSLSFV